MSGALRPPSCGRGYCYRLYRHVLAFLPGAGAGHADVTLIAPIDFLRVPLSAVIGWLLYKEQIDVFTAAGAALILAGNLLNLQVGPKRETEPVCR